VCVAHCDKGVLRMIDGKALVDLRHLNKCDLDGECVDVCPTDVVSLFVEPVEKAASASVLPITPLPLQEQQQQQQQQRAEHADMVVRPMDLFEDGRFSG
jgi:NAD-dependent dihydropyrimidine dehydrogenase PreA subunit